MESRTREVEVVKERERAQMLLHPLRLRVLEAAREPGSAAELARRLRSTPQKVNYHVGKLEAHGFLRQVEERRAGNLVEKVFAATAESYVLATEVLGGLSPRAALTEVESAGRWLGLLARAESELGAMMRSEPDHPVEAFSMEAEFRLETPEQRDLFERTVRDLLMAIVSKYTSAARTGDGDPGPGRPYRLVLGCYPLTEPDGSSTRWADEPETPRTPPR